MRVHELAKALDVPSKELMNELHRIKVQVEHHSNSLDDETVRKVMAMYQARRGGGGVVKKITRRAGAPAPSVPAPEPEAPPTPPAGSGGPRLVRRIQRPGAPLPPRPIGIGGSPMMPIPEGPPMSMNPLAPPPPLRIKPPSTIAPPKPVGSLAQPLAPLPSPQQQPTSSPEPPAAEGTAAPSPPPSPPLTPQAAPRPVKRDKKQLEPRRGTTIDLDTFKTVVTGQPADAKPAGKSRGKRGSRTTGKPVGKPAGKREGRDVRPPRRDTGRRAAQTPPTDDSAARKYRPSFLLHAPVQDRRRDSRRGARAGRAARMDAAPKKPKMVTIYGQVTVGEFAEKIGVPAPEIIKQLMTMGELLNINAILSDEMAELLAGEFGIQLTIIPETDEYDVRDYAMEDSPDDMVTRPPVVTVMGHVDHGKTSLLDRIRSTHVAEGEAGGITQHIGASTVTTERGDITFLDTPGHEAFTAMRARGANVTDLAVLVIAADDGVMPQTVESINHAKAAGVPLIVAVNKIDLPGANPDRAKQALMQYGLVPEDFGGDTICVSVSAKTGDGISDLLDMILLQSEVLELAGNPKRPAEGVIIESRVEPGRGVSATVLVQNGLLRLGDAFLAGAESGKIRAMVDARGHAVEEVAPGHAAEIVGLRGAPEAGEDFLVVPNERIAREISERRAHRRRQRDIAGSPLKGAAITDETGAVDLAAIAASQRDDFKELRLIVRADVQGSVEAVSQSLLGLGTEEIKIEILHSGVGAITTNDVNLAMTTDAEIVGFGVRPEQQAAQLAEQNRITIRLHRVIYELIDEIKAAMLGLREPVFQEKQHGHAEVRQIFRISRLGNIAGCYVLDGEIHRNHFIRLLRDNAVVTEKRRLGSLRRVKDDVSKVTAGMECGMTIDGFNDLKEGDVIEAFTLEEVAPQPLSR